MMEEIEMNNFVITTDNAADLPESFTEENEIGVLSLSCTIDGITYGTEERPHLPAEEFYQKLRHGAMPKTQQVNPEQAARVFRSYLRQGKDILHLALSSAVSGSFNSAKIAAEELKEEFPERTIEVIDTLVGSLAEGLVVDKAVQMKKAGKTLAEIAQWIKENRKHFCLYATVDDLKHLYRGGRVSKTTAFIGTAIGIKPILKLDETGNLVAADKARGRKRAIQTLVEKMEEHIGSFAAQNEKIYISHGDCLEDAEYLAELVREKFGISKAMIHPIGPVIGSHGGSSALALSFMGENK